MRHPLSSTTVIVIMLATSASAGQDTVAPEPDAEHKPPVYPNIPMELLLENVRVIVQRVQVEPGQCEGIYSHPGHPVFIHIKGGTWAGRMGGVQSATTTVRADGAVGWTEAIDLSEAHESGNVGDTELQEALEQGIEGAPRTVACIGDANAPAIIAAAVYAGHKYARELDCEKKPGERVRWDRVLVL